MTKVNKPKSFPFNNERLKEAAKKLNAIERNKPKLFEDYKRESYKNNTFDSLHSMLNDLAIKQAELERDNDLLRAQVTELTHKIDFVMEKTFSPFEGVDFYGAGCLRDVYKESLKKSDQGLPRTNLRETYCKNILGKQGKPLKKKNKRVE